jgi:hypothetical protein
MGYQGQVWIYRTNNRGNIFRREWGYSQTWQLKSPSFWERRIFSA